MPINREPHVYQGYVISMIGQSAGEKVHMEMKNAQACVACGTHRWADDTTDMPLGLQGEINKRKAERAGEIEADRIHFEKVKAGEEAPAEMVEDAISSKARPIYFSQKDGITYLARPFPEIIVVDLDAVVPASGTVAEYVGDDIASITITQPNAKATYKVLSQKDNIVIAEFDEGTMPDVDIPSDWRSLSHLKTIPMAKAIRGTKDSMTKAEAEAIIEEWTKPNDPVRIEGSTEKVAPQKPGEGPEAGNRDPRPFDPASEAKKAERALLDDGDGDVVELDKRGGIFDDDF